MRVAAGVSGTWESDSAEQGGRERSAWEVRLITAEGARHPRRCRSGHETRRKAVRQHLWVGNGRHVPESLLCREAAASLGLAQSVWGTVGLWGPVSPLAWGQAVLSRWVSATVSLTNLLHCVIFIF